jgi:transposase
MGRFVEEQDRRQDFLLPASLDDYVAEDNPVRVVEAFIDELDLVAVGFAGATPAPTGRPAYHPSTMLKIYLYGYLNRIQSSRLLEREAQRNIELMWLTGRLAPDFKTIANFRRDNGAAIRAVCSQFVALCRQLSLFGQATVAIDGSKCKAVNNRDRNYTEHKAAKRIEQVEASIERYLAALDRADREASDVPQARVEQICEKIAGLRGQMRFLKEMAAQVEAVPDHQVSLTDPDARSMNSSGRGTGIVGYNLQAAVDAEHHLIYGRCPWGIGQVRRISLPPIRNDRKTLISAVACLKESYSVGPTWKLKPIGRVVDGGPDSLGDIRFLRRQRRAGKCLENRCCETGISRRDEILDPHIAIVREPRGRGIARFHQFCADVEVSELMGERAGEALDGLLAGGIGRCQRHGSQRNARRHVDDDTRPAFAHLRNDCLAHRHDAECVGVEHFADMRHRRRLERADYADAGIIDEHIDRPGSRDGGGDAPFARDVEGQDAEVRRCLEKRGVGAAHGRDDMPPPGEEMTRRLQAIA